MATNINIVPLKSNMVKLDLQKKKTKVLNSIHILEKSYLLKKSFITQNKTDIAVCGMTPLMEFILE